MADPVKPNVVPEWTQGNNGQRQQPTDGEQFAGFTPNFRPPAKWHNWLFGIFSDWIEWLNFITTDGALPVSNTGHNVATGDTLQEQLDELDAAVSSLGFVQEVPTGTVNGTNTNFQLSQAPINNQSVMVSVDGGQSFITSDFTIQQISGDWFVVFAVAPTAGQQPYALYMTGSSGVGVGGGVASIENDIVGGSVGLFRNMVINVAHFKSLIAGTNVSITDNGDGTVTISATGGGGGAIENHGSAAAPILLAASAQIAASSANDQVWWIKPNAGANNVPMTNPTVIAAGTVVGQRLTLKSVAVTGGQPYFVVPNNAGTDMNGPVAMGPFAQSIEYMWDGAKWSENSRRV